MIRFLGILAGSAIGVAVLILVVGVPEFPDEPVAEPIEVPPETAAAPIEKPRETEEAPIEAQTAAVEAVEAPPVVQTEAADAPLEAQTERLEMPAETTHWYAFWSPFRSELAANGFVSQLQKTTGLDYRVVKQKIGVYEVAFAYVDEADIETKLAQISAATGLDVPES